MQKRENAKHENAKIHLEKTRSVQWALELELGCFKCQFSMKLGITCHNIPFMKLTPGVNPIKPLTPGPKYSIFSLTNRFYFEK